MQKEFQPTRVEIDDPRIETEIGMRQAHAERLLEFCNGRFKARQLIIVVRQSCQRSLRWQGLPKHLPKPPTLKDKINTMTGRTPSPLSRRQQAFRRYAPSPEQGAMRLSPLTGQYGDHPGKGWWYISDYDLHGVYELRHTGNYDRLYISNHIDHAGVRIGTARQADIRFNPFLNAINRYVCNFNADHPERAFFQHGPEDDFRIAGRSGHRIFEGKALNERGKVTKPHIVFEHTGAMYLLEGEEVQEYYRMRKISYMW